MVLPSQLKYQFASNDQRLLIGQCNGLPRLNGVDGGRQSGKANHSCKHHVDGAGLDNLVQCLSSGIDLHIGQIIHQRLQFVVVLFVGNDYGSRLELMGLLGQ